MSSDFDGLHIFPAPCSRYEQFVNPYSNLNKNQPRRARFAAPIAEWTSAKKAGCIYTVVQAMKENLQSRGSNVESQKSKKLAYKPARGLSAVTGRCTEPGCCWVFASAADKERHVRLVHRKTESHKSGSDSMHSECDSAPQAKKQKVYKTCNVCLKAFPSAHYLTKHKQEAGHKKK